MKELIELQSKCQKELDSIPAFQNYLAVTKTIELLAASNPALSTTTVLTGDSNLKTTPEQKEAFIKGVDEYFAESNGKPTAMKDLTVILRNKGLVIPGKNPGTTLAAILTGQKAKYMMQKGLWSPAKKAAQGLLLEVAA